jgi:hypothetical protein
MTTPGHHTDTDLDPASTPARAGYGEPGGADTGQQGSRAAEAHPNPEPTAGGTGTDTREPLVPQQRSAAYTARWNDVKGAFVDEPRQAVAAADQLVSELLDELQELFRSQRHAIEQGLDADQTSTEDLRLALGRYRSFFDRLLSV